MRWVALLGILLSSCNNTGGSYNSNRGYVISKSPIEAEQLEVEETEELAH